MKKVKKEILKEVKMMDKFDLNQSIGDIVNDYLNNDRFIYLLNNSFSFNIEGNVLFVTDETVREIKFYSDYFTFDLNLNYKLEFRYDLNVINEIESEIETYLNDEISVEDFCDIIDNYRLGGFEYKGKITVYNEELNYKYEKEVK